MIAVYEKYIALSEINKKGVEDLTSASGPTCWKKNRAWFKLLKSKKIGVTNGNLNMELVP